MAKSFDWSKYEEKPSTAKFDWDAYREDKSSSETPVEEQKPTKGWAGVLSDVLQAGKETPGALKNIVTELPGEALESGKQFFTDNHRFKKNVLAGLLLGLKGAVNTPTIIQNYLKSKDLYTPLPWENKNPSELPIPQDTGLQKQFLGEPRKGDIFTQGISSFAPYAAAGGITGLGIIPQMGAQAIGQEQNPITAMLTGRAFQGIPAVGKAVSTGYENLRPSVMFRGKLSPEELQTNMRATEGTNTPLGRVLEEPKLTGMFENVTSQMPFAGGKTILDTIKKQVEAKAENIVEGLKPEGASGDLNNLTQSLLREANRNQKDIKNNMYEERNAIAEAEGHKLKLPTFEKAAKQEAKSIKNSPLYMNDSDFRSAYNKLRGYRKTSRDIPEVKSSILDQYGNPIILKEAQKIPPSLTEAQVTANTLESKAKEWNKSPAPADRAIAGKIKYLASALRKDIKDSVKTGSPELQAAQKQADQNYKENYSPFVDKSIYKKLVQENPEKFVNEIIKPGKVNDQYADIEKVVKLLPKGQENLLGYAYLKSRATNKLGEVEPKKLAQAVEALGTRQFEKMFPDPTVRQALLDYGKMRGMNEKALNVLYNPETGAKLLPTIMGAGLVTNPIKMIGGLIGSRIANKNLTSPAFREKLINKMIENSKKNQTNIPNKENASQYLSEALMGASQSVSSKQKKND